MTTSDTASATSSGFVALPLLASISVPLISNSAAASELDGVSPTAVSSPIDVSLALGRESTAI